jgi:hypothetical protein
MVNRGAELGPRVLSETGRTDETLELRRCPNSGRWHRPETFLARMVPEVSFREGGSRGFLPVGDSFPSDCNTCFPRANDDVVCITKIYAVEGGVD